MFKLRVGALRIHLFLLGAALLAGPLTAEAQLSTHGMMIPANVDPIFWDQSARLTAARARYTASPSTYALASPATGTETTVVNQAFIKVMRGTCSAANGGSTTMIDTCGDAVNWILNVSSFNCPSNCDRLDDDARWFGELTILTYSWLRDQLTAAQRQAVLAGMVRAVGGTFSKGWGSPEDTGNNYNWGYTRNGILLGIVMAKEAQAGAFTPLTTNCSWPGESGGRPMNYCNMNAMALQDAMLDEALDVRWPQMVQYLSNQAKGGAVPEGANYGHYLLHYYTMPMAIMGDYGRALVEETPYWKEAAWNLIYATTNLPMYAVQDSRTIAGFPRPWHQVPTYGNTQAVNGAPPAGHFEEGAFMTWMAVRYDGTFLGDRIRFWINKVNPQRPPHLKAIDPDLNQPGASFASLPLDYCSSGFQFCHLRDSWDSSTGSKPTGFFIEAGAVWNPGGNHPDCSAGSWQAWRGQRWISKEAANAYARTNTNLSGTGAADAGMFMSHNRMTVNDTQTNGFCSVPASPLPTVSRRMSEPGFFYLSTDLRQHSGLGSTVTALVRDFLYIRELDTLCTFDRMQTTTAGATKNTFVHFPVSPVRNGNTFTGTNNGEGLYTVVLAASVAGQSVTYTVRDEGAYGTGRNTDNDPQYRLEVRTSGTAMSYVPICAQGFSSGDALISVAAVEDADSIDLTLSRAGASTYVASFAKGATSAGGSLRVGNGATVPFANTIEPVVADQSLVAWDGQGTVQPPPPPRAPSGFRMVQ
jgi:hypothetical protein